jgi:ribokinase
VSTRRVVVVGDVMLDVIVKPAAAIAPTSDTPAHVRLSRGGSATNIAVAIAKFGHEVTFVGAAGDDVAATIIVDALTKTGVETALERVKQSTGVVVALVGDDAQRAMLTDRGANPHLSLGHVLAQLAEPFDHLHVSGYTLLDQSTRAVGTAALARAHELGCSTSIDVCSVAPLASVTPRVFLEAAANTTMLFANEEEALLLSGLGNVHSALDLLSEAFPEVMVTLGANGATAHSVEGRVDVRASSDSVLDTTGAGDAATGAYLALRLRGEPMESALHAAMREASLVVRGLGSLG